LLYGFDVLQIDDEPLLPEPYDVRRQRLLELGLDAMPRVAVPPAFTDAMLRDMLTPTSNRCTSWTARSTSWCRASTPAVPAGCYPTWWERWSTAPSLTTAGWRHSVWRGLRPTGIPRRDHLTLPQLPGGRGLQVWRGKCPLPFRCDQLPHNHRSSPERISEADADWIFYSSYGPRDGTAEGSVVGGELWNRLGAVQRGEPRDGAWVLEVTGLLDLSRWPTGMRVIVRKERPHPGAQLRLTDADGHRLTAFATNAAPGGPHRQLADLELRHRRRARAEDRIRAAKDTGLTNLPLQGLDQNRIWCAIIALACELTAWAQMLALTDHPARRWEPKRLRLRLFSSPAA
jgi:hypothetical protein